jgi:hypothetical protein
MIEIIGMSSSLTLENRLILACARTDPDVNQIQDLIGRAPDWQVVLRRTEHWGLAPLVYASIRQLDSFEQVPTRVTDQLRHLYRRDTIHSVAQRELLGLSLLRFVEAGVPVIVLQGAALATLVYPAPNLRPIGDIDLLVHAHDHAQAESLLAGVQADYPDIPYLGPEGIHQIKLHEQVLAARGSAGRRAAARLATQDAWKRAQAARIESVTTLVLSHEDLLLQLALRFSASGRVDGHVRALCDIRETCARYGSEIDWGRLVMQAEGYQVAKQLAYALGMAGALAGAAVPAPALAALRASFGQLPFEDRLIFAVAREAILADNPGGRPASTLYALGVQLLATRSAADGLRVAGRHLARSCRAGLWRLGTQLSRRRARVSRSAGARPAVNASPPEARHTHVPQRIEERTPTEVVQPEGIPHSPGALAVTYDQHGASDGVGAQVQRIYGLYALARALDIKYVHTPLERVGYQGFISLLTRRSDPNFVERYNAFFSLPSDDFDLEGCERVKIHNLNLATVERYRAQAAATGRSILLETLLPFAYTDKYPAAYRTLREVSPYRDHQPSGPIRVCIHLRRGDNLPDSRRRWLPNSYYLRVCGQILEALQKQGAPSIVRLHSELPTRRYALYPLSPGLYFEPEQPVTIDPADYALEDFDALPNLEMLFNAEPLNALRDFATADVLILSASSFGYLGGMLNPHGVVVFAPFTWNAPLPDWLVADEHGNLSADEVAAKIAALLQRRG